jgi:hypothetical protein
MFLFIFLIINIFLNVIHGRGEISKKQTTWLLYLQEKCKSNCPPRGFRTGTCVAFDNHPVADCCGDNDKKIYQFMGLLFHFRDHLHLY